MTKDEFVRRRKSLGSENPPFNWAIAIALWALLIVGVPVGFLASKIIAVAYVGFLLIVAIGCLVYLLRWDQKTGLLCHNCHRPLLRRAADIAVETGTCPNCRKSAFSSQILP